MSRASYIIIAFRAKKQTISTILTFAFLSLMDRYLTGGAKKDKPPEKKRFADKRERDADYDKRKRQRGYLKSWERENPWLAYDDVKSVMFCTWCRAFQHVGIRGKNAFAEGTDNFRPDTVRAHGGSEARKRSEGRHLAATLRPGTAPAHRAIQAMNAATMQRLKHLFR